MRYKVWHISQVTMKVFERELDSLADAFTILDILADYDKFQLENNVKPEYANVQGLMVMKDGEWVEW